MLRQRFELRRAFTLVEILVVVMILGLVSAVIIPQIGSRDDLRCAASARIVMSDLIYAQNLAISQQQPRFVKFGTNQYGVYASGGATTPIVHPVNKTPYLALFGANGSSGLNSTSIESRSFDGSPNLAFDELGGPYKYDAVAGTLTPLAVAGEIVLVSGSHRLKVSIEPLTGEVTVAQDQGMLKLTRTQALPIGIDIGADSIKMLQLQIVGDSLQVVCAARESMPAAPANDVSSRAAVAIDVIRRALRENEFRGRSAIVSLPRELVHLKNLRLPPMPLAEIGSVLQFEAKNLFPFDVEQSTMCHLVAGEVRQGAETKQELIVLAAKNPEIEQYVEQLHDGGIVLESLDYEPCAIYRSIERFMRRKEDDHDVHVLVDVGLRRSQVIIGKGREISLIKPIEIGGQHLRDAIARKLGISAEEAVALRRRLAESASEDSSAARRDSVRQAVYDVTRGMMEDLGREVSLCLRYYSVTFRGARPAKVRVIGGEAADPQLLQILNGTLSIPVETGKPVQNVDYSQMRPTLRQGAMCDWSAAMGLSLKGTDLHFSGKEGRPRGEALPVADSEAKPAGQVRAMAARMLGLSGGGVAHA